MTWCHRCQSKAQDCLCDGLFADADAREDRGEAQWQKRRAR